MTVTKEQTAADLRAAAAVIRERGWTKNAYISPDGGCCVVGAIELATGVLSTDGSRMLGGSPRASRAYLQLWQAVRPIIRGGPIAWNDEVVESAEQVIEKLEQVAAELEEQSWASR